MDSVLPQQEYLTGARILDVFMQKKDLDRRDKALLEIRHCEPSIWKLVGTLSWRRDDEREIRTLAARIVAELASDGELRLARFPGAALSVSSLLEIIPEQNPGQRARQKGNEQKQKQKQQLPQAKTEDRRSDESQPLLHQHESSSVSAERTECSTEDTGRELIVRGLQILEGLASGEDNCREISNTPGLVSKITAPVMNYSILRDIERDAIWVVDVVGRSVKVVSKLIGSGGLDLRRQALEILTKLGGDSGSANQFIGIVLHIFLDKVEFPVETEKKIELDEKIILMKNAAGEALGELTKESPSNAAVILAQGGTVVQKLTNMLLGANHENYRTSAAEILEHLCAYSRKEEEDLLKAAIAEVLPQVLKKNTRKRVFFSTRTS